MAGNYADVPGHRMALDSDGSAMYVIDGSNNITQLNETQLKSLNDESDSVLTGAGGISSVVAIFPERRDLTGYYLLNKDNSGRGANGGWLKIDVSSDTTNGLDGTWTTIATNVALGGNEPVSPSYRTKITAVSSPGIKGVRAYNNGGQIAAYHLYGSIAAGQNPDRLVLWHPTLDTALTGAYFDWGDVRRGSVADRQFRIKNISDTATANTINVSLSALSDTTPSIVSQHTLSSDGTNFSSSISVGNLAPGQISGTLTLRRTLLNNTGLSLWAIRIKASAASWS